MNDIFNVFVNTNILVKIITFILIGLSVMSWSIILNRFVILKTAKYKFKIFEDKFWSGIELSRLYQDIITHRNRLNESEHIFYAGFQEFSKLYPIKHYAPETITARTLRVMHNAMNIELEKLSNYIPIIGLIGSISPYFGLFGTVLGIMHVFLELGQTTANQILYMQIVAPGIAEALISTAIGLFVAIPAVMAFNYLNIKINTLDQNYNNFIEEFITILYSQVFFNSDNELNEGNQHEEKTLKIHD